MLVWHITLKPCPCLEEEEKEVKFSVKIREIKLSNNNNIVNKIKKVREIKIICRYLVPLQKHKKNLTCRRTNLNINLL